MNFELILTALTLVSFIFWLIHKYVTTNPVIDFLQSFFTVLFFVLVVRSFLFEPFRIPSSSMRPTLVIGDFILVNKFTYGPRLPVLRTKLFEGGTPKRGDIIVFKYPEDPSFDFIKRVVAVPGDKIEVKEIQIFINDKPASLIKMGEKQWFDGECRTYTSAVLEEKLPGKTHQIMDMSERNIVQNSTRIVPQGKYFVMGDNRDNSRDSRFWGYVPEENIVGKAQAIWMNIDWTGDCGKGIQLGRIGGIESN